MLVDAKNSDDFYLRLDQLEWNAKFLEWFRQYKADEIISDLLRPIREAAGLGCPPAKYYTNASECINSVMHEKTHYKASEWDQFNDSMHKLVKQSYQLTELAVIDRGAYCYREPYKHFCIDQLVWIRMTSKQREIHLRKTNSISVVGPLAHVEELTQNRLFSHTCTSRRS